MIFVVEKNFISTINHINFDPTEPSWDDIIIEDIAHALSMMTRANGHFTEFYSVARHSINCAIEASVRGYTEKVQLLCLMHDAAEAYIGDMTRPLKLKIPYFSEVEKKYQDIIFPKFVSKDLSEDDYKRTREIDDAFLYAEFSKYNGERLKVEHTGIHLDLAATVKSIAETETEFLALYRELKNKVH